MRLSKSTQITAVIALITHPNTGRNERNAALKTFRNITGQEYNIVDARQYLKSDNHTPTERPQTRRKSLFGKRKEVVSAPQPTANEYQQGAAGNGSCNAGSTCTPGRNPCTTYMGADGREYQGAPAWSTVDNVHAEYDSVME